MVKILAIFLLCAVIPTGLALAQDDACESLVENAFGITQDACASIGDEEACYGNASVTAHPGDLEFDSAGDMVGLAELQSLRLSSMDVDQGEWGISLMRITANMPEVASPVSVDVVLFGNVEVENTAGDSGFAPMQAFYFRAKEDDPPLP